MKIRIGFVSNSSSSSFVLSSTGEEIEVTLTLKMPLNDLIGDIVHNVDELNKYMVDNHGWKGVPLEDLLEDLFQEPWIKEEYDKCLEAINRGEYVLFGKVRRNDNNPLSRHICDNGFDKVEFSTDVKVVRNVER